jgi:hypothetical protein
MYAALSILNAAVQIGTKWSRGAPHQPQMRGVLQVRLSLSIHPAMILMFPKVGDAHQTTDAARLSRAL